MVIQMQCHRRIHTGRAPRPEAKLDPHSRRRRHQVLVMTIIMTLTVCSTKVSRVKRSLLFIRVCATPAPATIVLRRLVRPLVRLRRSICVVRCCIDLCVPLTPSCSCSSSHAKALELHSLVIVSRLSLPVGEKWRDRFFCCFCCCLFVCLPLTLPRHYNVVFVFPFRSQAIHQMHRMQTHQREIATCSRAVTLYHHRRPCQWRICTRRRRRTCTR